MQSKLAFAITLAVAILLSQGRAIAQVKHGGPIELPKPTSAPPSGKT